MTISELAELPVLVLPRPALDGAHVARLFGHVQLRAQTEVQTICIFANCNVLVMKEPTN